MIAILELRPLLAAGLLGLSALAFGADKQTQRVKVFVLAGQSNMEGQAVVDLTGKDYNDGKGTLATLMSIPEKRPLFKHLKNSDGTWNVRNDVFVRYQREKQPLLTGPLGFGFSVYGDQHHFGPEYQLGHVLGDYFKEPVLLIKTAWGGKSLYEDFRPPSSGGKTGKYYKLMLSDVKTALSNMEADFPACKGRGYELAGLVWYQGWNDGVDPKRAVPEYEQNLVNLIRDVRKEFNSPKLPVVVGELTGPWVKAEGAWDMLRKAQENAVERYEVDGNALFVPTHDFVREAEDSPNPTHGHHEFGNAETIFLVGDALGKGMVSLLENLKAPMIKDYGLKPYVRLSKDLPHSENKPWKLVCTMPTNCHFQMWMELESEAGKQVLLNSSNPLVQYLTKTESYTTIAGPQTTEAKNWLSGEGAIYTIPAGVTVKAVKYRETGFDTTFAGSFECNDRDFNVLWTKAARTAYVCMRDHFYDCPDRERVGFWGDGTPELDQCFYVFDTKAHRLAKDLVLRKLQPKFYPGQHLEFLGEYGLWFYYMHTGDLDSIRAVYDQTKVFLFETYKFGNKGTWFDWGKENKDTAVIETCFYYNCMETLLKMAKVTGHNADVPLIEKKLQDIKATFDQKFWKGGYYMSSQVSEPDDRANAMAVNAGLADKKKWEAIYTNVLAKKTYSSCFFDRWVFEALCKIGRPEAALMRMATRYKTMIPASITTLWEHYDRWWASHIDAFDEGSSLNHGWNPPALILSKTITGVEPTLPGWTEFQVLPKVAFLNSIKMTVPTVKGKVRVEINKSASQYSLRVTVPIGSSAVLGVPIGSFTNLQSVALQGREVWRSGFTGEISGATYVDDKNGYVKFKVEPGVWTLVGRGLVEMDSPKPLPVAKRKEIELEKRGWSASASVPDSTFLFSGDNIPIDVSAENATDGDVWNGWRDMTKTQYPGQWFQVDMKSNQSFDKIVLDNTWALWDSPQRYEVRVSSDGIKWSEVIASGRGELGITNITFPMQHARFIRITQTGSSSLYHWSIYELNVCRGRK
jgi:hypothetical protein